MQAPGDADGPLPTLPTLPPLLRLANQLEQAWNAAPSSLPPPNLSDFLPPSGDFLRPMALQELVRVDLEMRWRRGLPVLLESYLQQFPELGKTASLPVELIYQEYCIRRQYGDQPSLAHYQQRFPAQYRLLLFMAQEEASRSPAGKASPPAAVSKVDTSSREIATQAPADPGNKAEEILTPPSAPPLGDKKTIVSMVGGYRLLERLGDGALGVVWKAEAPGGVEVAVKRLKRTLEAHEAQCELKSLEHVKRVRHNYLTQIHAFWVHKGRLHVVMELADGSLSDEAERCRARGLPGIRLEDLIRYLREAAEALDFLHDEGVHHRDIKPANILLLKGHVKVADFGLVRPLQETQSMVKGTFCGTPVYMAPEIWDNKFSIHSDQWSLAVTYLELRLNRPVFKSRTIPSLMTEIRKGQFDLKPLAAAEQRVLRRALHAEPRQRYPNCTAFVQALEAIFRPPASPPPRRRSFLLAALFASLAAGGLFVYLLVLLFLRPARLARLDTDVPPQVRVDTGKETSFFLPFVRQNYEGPVQFVPDLEQPYVIVKGEARAGENVAVVSVHVESGADLHPRRVHLRTTTDNIKLEGVFAFDLTILYLPPGYEAMGSEPITDDRGVAYYPHLRRPLNAASAIEFLLVPQKKEDLLPNVKLQDPSTFYVSRFKISRGQFQHFAAQQPRVDGRWRKLGDDSDSLPVRDVTVSDAHAFAEWLGGRLPSMEQWDRAAGRYHRQRGSSPHWEGPYEGRWKDKLRIAVGGLTMPLPLGSPGTEDDKSVYGCRDMAGNGSEWTRKTRRKGDVPLKHVLGVREEDVYLRGWSFEQAKPLSFEQMDEEEQQDNYRMEEYQETSPSLGFRVVLEPNG